MAGCGEAGAQQQSSMLGLDRGGAGGLWPMALRGRRKTGAGWAARHGHTEVDCLVFDEMHQP